MRKKKLKKKNKKSEKPDLSFKITTFGKTSLIEVVDITVKMMEFELIDICPQINTD